MIEVTEKAQEKIDNYLQENSVKAPIRIQVAEGCCGGPYLGIAVDEFVEGDNRYEANGVTYVIAKDLIERVGQITIDFVEKKGMTWFQVSSQNPLPEAQTGGEPCCS
ncbi:MAG: IscA/HesB family protein [Desulfobacteraceae bacterium]|nr:MAG: IscA/HesB family protein [Desulfobacteraceae bacterium]